MQDTGSSNSEALLVVDVQVGVMRGLWEAQRTVGNIAVAVEAARRSGVPVLWIQHQDQELSPGSPDWQLVPALVPAPGESSLSKDYNSAFEDTSLQQELLELGVSHIFLCGAATNWCIRATAYAALERGYDLTLLADAHTTESIETAEGQSIPAQSIINELNAVLPWLSYPHSKVNVACTGDVAFGAAAKPM